MLMFNLPIYCDGPIFNTKETLKSTIAPISRTNFPILLTSRDIATTNQKLRYNAVLSIVGIKSKPNMTGIVFHGNLWIVLPNVFNMQDKS